MAERRMFARSVVNSDSFLDMPASTRALYFHLGMEADDDGFLNNPKGLVRYFGSAQDDLKLLISKGFLIPFDSGVVVIRHWKQSNYIQKDRYRHTKCKTEFEMLSLSDGVYSLDAGCIHDVHSLDTGCIHSTGKDKLELEIVEDNSILAQSCKAASEPMAKKEPAVYQFLCTKGDVVDITQKQIDTWRDAYPAVDIDVAIRQMLAWLDANPSRRKTARGCKAFITRWLGKEQDRGTTPRRENNGGFAGNDAPSAWDAGTI